MKHLKLPAEHVETLKTFTRSGTKNVREVNRVYMLLWLDKGKTVAEIEELLDVERTAIWRTKTNYLEKGLDHAIKDNPRPGQPKKYKQKQQAEIIALACSDPPEGRMYVAEMPGYPTDDSDESFSRVMLLEDSNEDGYYDKSTVFADDLTFCKRGYAMEERYSCNPGT